MIRKQRMWQDWLINLKKKNLMFKKISLLISKNGELRTLLAGIVFRFLVLRFQILLGTFLFHLALCSCCSLWQRTAIFDLLKSSTRVSGKSVS